MVCSYGLPRPPLLYQPGENCPAKLGKFGNLDKFDQNWSAKVGKLANLNICSKLAGQIRGICQFGQICSKLAGQTEKNSQI